MIGYGSSTSVSCCPFKDFATKKLSVNVLLSAFHWDFICLFYLVYEGRKCPSTFAYPSFHTIFYIRYQMLISWPGKLFQSSFIWLGHLSSFFINKLGPEFDFFTISNLILVLGEVMSCYESYAQPSMLEGSPTNLPSCVLRGNGRLASNPPQWLSWAI